LCDIARTRIDVRFRRRVRGRPGCTSKIEAGKLDSISSPVNLARLIDQVIGTAGGLAEKNQNRLVVEAQENLGTLNADSMRLKQILLNLLSNACKFTKEGVGLASQGIQIRPRWYPHSSSCRDCCLGSNDTRSDIS
jgi:hypothetical protein